MLSTTKKASLPQKAAAPRKNPSKTTQNAASVIDVGFEIGDKVVLESIQKVGKVKFIGRTHFASGIWVGIELSDPSGKNSGIVHGQKYFSCKPSHGLFVRPNSCSIAGASAVTDVSENKGIFRKSSEEGTPQKSKSVIWSDSVVEIQDNTETEKLDESFEAESVKQGLDVQTAGCVAPSPVAERNVLPEKNLSQHQFVCKNITFEILFSYKYVLGNGR